MTKGSSVALLEPIALTPDLASVHQLYEQRATQLWTFGRRLGLAGDEAEDAVQEAFARYVRATQGDAALRQPGAWLFRTVHNLAMDHHRRTRRVRFVDPNDRGSPEVPEADQSIDLWAAVDRLPERQRAVIYLRYRADFDFATIARILSISAIGARASAFRALRRLREEIDR